MLAGNIRLALHWDCRCFTAASIFLGSLLTQWPHGCCIWRNVRHWLYHWQIFLTWPSDILSCWSCNETSSLPRSITGVGRYGRGRHISEELRPLVFLQGLEGLCRACFIATLDVLHLHTPLSMAVSVVGVLHQTSTNLEKTVYIYIQIHNHIHKHIHIYIYWIYIF